METLAEAYPKQQARCRELLQTYIEIGPAGAFAVAMLRDLLARADRASAEQDVVSMINCFKEMQDCG